MDSYKDVDFRHKLDDDIWPLFLEVAGQKLTFSGNVYDDIKEDEDEEAVIVPIGKPKGKFDFKNEGFDTPLDAFFGIFNTGDWPGEWPMVFKANNKYYALKL